MSSGGEPSGLVDRRTALKGIVGVAGGALLAAAGVGPAGAQRKKLRLAFCSQLLCIIPYEVARANGHFAAEGLEVELVYTRGGNAAMQALVGGAVDYAATSFDVAILAFARGAKILRFASTGRLPLFALATAPARAKEIGSLKALENRTVGVSALGNADHTILLFLLQKAGADPERVRFAVLGPNMYDAVRLGQVDAGMVQEPALSLLTEAGARVIVNAMDIEDANRHLGGAYEFMGVAVRAEEREKRLEEMRRLARALGNALRAVQSLPASKLVEALPRELLAGADRKRLEAILGRYRGSLYPQGAGVDAEACARVVTSLKAAGVLPGEVDLAKLLDRSLVGG